MFRRTLYIAALTLAACNAETAISEDVTISNFKSGLVCPYKINAEGERKRDGFICHVTEEIKITGQGRCTYDGEVYPCTWYGFEFEFTNKTGMPQTVDCTLTTDMPANYGNPKGLKKQNTESLDYSFTLEGATGRFYNPQYSLFSQSQKSSVSQVSHTICSIKGKPLFEFKRIQTYP